jgi:hypothetical protein
VTQSPNSINPAEDLYDLAALHCILLPAQGTDRSRAFAAARDCNPDCALAPELRRSSR